MKPEQKARQRIDQLLEQAGWLVQDYAAMNITAGLGVAVREFRLKTGFADYMLYADAKAIGVVEAKPAGHTLTGVETQSGKYLDDLPNILANHQLPLPFAYESTGEVTQFTYTLEADARSRPVFTFHRPEELIRLVKLDHQMRTLLKAMPDLDAGRLWKVQIDSIHNVARHLKLLNGQQEHRALGDALLVAGVYHKLLGIGTAAAASSTSTDTATKKVSKSGTTKEEGAHTGRHR